MEKLMSLRKFVKQVKKPVQEIKVEPITKVSDFLSEALEYKSGNDEQFAVDLVAEIDDNIGSIDGEISKDSRPGKNTGKRIGVQIVLPASKRIAFTSMANEVINKDTDLELKKPSTTREKDYGNLCQAISAAEVIQKNYGGGADKVYLTGKAWDNDVKQFQVTKYGMKDYNASDFIIKKGNSFLGVSLKKKISATTADPTLINKGFSTMIQGSEFDKVRNELDVAAGEFYVRLVKSAQILQRRKPKVAVDKDGNPWLDAAMIKELGNRGQGINTGNWQKFVQRIPNELVNYQLKKSKSWFKPLADAVVKNSDLFGQQLLQLIFKMDLQDLKKLNFDFALYVGSTPISDITLRYKGNFRAAPNFLATPTKEFKELLKR